ncbi:MAG: hypothetical protein AAF985_04290 [Bacteroidota bacterium]
MKLSVIFRLSFFCFIFFLMTCRDKDGFRNIRAYYFPVDALENGMVYEYESVNNDSLPIEYWYYRTQKTDTATYFTANYYDQQFIVRQFSNEIVVDNGTLLHSYFLYEFDSTGLQYQKPAEVLSPSAFPFEVRDSGGIFLLKLKWTHQEDPPVYTTLIRNRRYAGRTTYEYRGKTYDAVVFELKELVDDFNNGHWEGQYNGKEIYAKGLGLVYYKKEVEKDFILEYALKDTFSMDELERRYQKTLGMK